MSTKEAKVTAPVLTATAPLSGPRKATPFLYKQLIQTLEDRVRRGELQVGDLVPSENQLIKEFQVSRVTVRKALLELEQRGIVTRLHGKGTYINSSTVPQLLQAEARTIVETFEVAGVDLDVEILSLEHVDPPSHVAAVFGELDQKVVCLTRRYSSDGLPIGVVSLYLPLAMSGVAYILKDSRDAKETSYSVFEKQLGISIGLVKHVVKTAAIDVATAEALDLEEGHICLSMDRITRSSHGGVLEVMSFVYAPGRVSFEIELPRHATGMTIRLADYFETT